MKFKDYEAKRKALEAKESARYEANQPDRDKLEKVRQSIKREWSLGPPRYLDSGASNERGEIVVVYDGGQDVRVQVRDASLPGYYGADLSGQFLRLFPAQWCAFAEITNALIRWFQGELNELPPSGKWPT